MTHSGGQTHKTGYQGQQYEVSFYDPDADKRRVFGWTNDADEAKRMAESIELHPTWEMPWITDIFSLVQHDGHPEESAVTPNVK
jgi:hypothetical protein